MCCRWVLTVVSAMPSAAAISRFVMPWASRASTICSRGVRCVSSLSVSSSVTAGRCLNSSTSRPATFGDSHASPRAVARMAGTTSSWAEDLTT